MKTTSGSSQYLICEQKTVFALLMMSSGMMGAYTFNLRGGIFCNAQTANFVMMALAFGKGDLFNGFYFLIPITAYFLGSLLSEALPSPIKHLKFLRWDTYLILFEIIILFLIGFIPLNAPHQIVQVTINFIASMQYNTFRQAEGVPMATTFCTNHLRQVGVACAKALRKKEPGVARRALIHISMLFSFVLGGALLTFCCRYLAERAIWVALIPMGIVVCKLVCADLGKEHDKLNCKPSGH